MEEILDVVFSIFTVEYFFIELLRTLVSDISVFYGKPRDFVQNNQTFKNKAFLKETLGVHEGKLC